MIEPEWSVSGTYDCDAVQLCGSLTLTKAQWTTPPNTIGNLYSHRTTAGALASLENWTARAGAMITRLAM